MTDSPRILILAEGLIGDSLVLTPAIRDIKEYFNKSNLSILLFNRQKYSTGQTGFEDAIIKESSFKGVSEVFLNNPNVDQVLELDKNALLSLNVISRIKAEIKNISILRNNKYDIIICTFPKDRFAIYSFLSGSKIRVGLRYQPFGFLLNKKADITEKEFNVIQYFSRLLVTLNIKNNNHATIFNVTKEAGQKATDFIISKKLENSKNIVGIHPGSSMNDRKWPAEYFAKLINYLKSKELADVILFYTDYDAAFINDIKKYIKVDIVEAKTKSLTELGALLKKCNICITHNSGPRHLAAAVGTRTLGLLFKFDDKRWGIYDREFHPFMKSQKKCNACPPDKCYGVIPNNEIYSSVCMRDIEPDDVINKVVDILEHQYIK